MVVNEGGTTVYNRPFDPPTLFRVRGSSGRFFCGFVAFSIYREKAYETQIRQKPLREPCTNSTGKASGKAWRIMQANMKLWQKHWKLASAVEAFETKDDLTLDAHLVGADCAGSIAHGAGLLKIGLLTHEEFETARRGLSDIMALWQQGKFTLRPGDEDVHTKIENTLTTQCGPVGKKIHTGRSRNDQVVTAIRIYTKSELLGISQKLLVLMAAFWKFAHAHEMVPMPGYTHMQKAMPSSVGMWAASYAEGLLDGLSAIKHSYALSDQSPLGSAAAYGVPIPLDREYTARLLGFAKIQQNSLACQNERGVIEAQVVSSLVMVLQLLSKFADDVLLFTTSEFDTFKVADELCSGSSIMPQKRNVDIAELIRSKVHILLGNYVALVGISSGLPSGYNRDLQDTKKPLFESLWLTGNTIDAAILLLAGLAPNEAKLRLAMTNELFAAHQAFALVAKGRAFRDAYHSVGSSARYVSALENNAIDQLLTCATHSGATGNLGLSQIRRRIAGERAMCRKMVFGFEKAMHALTTGGDPV